MSVPEWVPLQEALELLRQAAAAGEDVWLSSEQVQAVLQEVEGKQVPQESPARTKGRKP
jgi:hypothetical protein